MVAGRDATGLGVGGQDGAHLARRGRRARADSGGTHGGRLERGVVAGRGAGGLGGMGRHGAHLAVADGALVRILAGHTHYVSSVAWSPDGMQLASGSGDKTVRIWRVADGALVRTLEGHTSYVLSVAWSPDGTQLASGSGDKTVRIWRVADGALVRTLAGHTDMVLSVAWSPHRHAGCLGVE